MGERADFKALFGSTLNPDGSLRAVSSTQAIMAERCMLRWHFAYKAHLKKKPMGKGAAIGDAAHDRLKVFLKTSQDVRGPLELVGAEMLAPYLWAAPFKKGPGLVEEALVKPYLYTPGGILLTGYFDLYIPGLTGHDGTGMEWPTVIDHKFKKDLAKWGYLIGEEAERRGGSDKRSAADEEKLKNDPQTLIYGNWALTRQPEVDGVVMRHHQHQTEGEGGRFALPAEVRMTRGELLKRWGVFTKLIDEGMRSAACVPAAGPGLTPEGVSYNTGACGDFGGCDFALTCKHSPSNRFSALLGGPRIASSSTNPPHKGSPMSLLTQATGAKPATAQPSTPQTEGQMVAALTSMTEVALAAAKAGEIYMIPGGSVGRFEALLGGRGIFRAKDGGLVEVKEGTLRTTDEETKCLFEGRPYVKPTPPAPAPVAPAMVGAAAAVEAATGTAPAADAAKAEKKRKLGIVDVTDAQPAGTAAVAPVDAANAAPAPQAPPPAEVKVTTAEAVAAEPAKPKGKKPPTVTTVEPIDPTKTDGPLFLIVNGTCNKAVDLAGYVKSLCDAVATHFGTPDVRLGQKQSDLAFGGWKAILALEATKNPPKGLCAIQSSELADPVIEALIPLASVVIRGGR